MRKLGYKKHRICEQIVGCKLDECFCEYDKYLQKHIVKFRMPSKLGDYKYEVIDFKNREYLGSIADLHKPYIEKAKIAQKRFDDLMCRIKPIIEPIIDKINEQLKTIEKK